MESKDQTIQDHAMTKEEIKEMLQKIKDTSNGTKFAELRIKQLDETVAHLKKKRSESEKKIEAYKQDLSYVEKQIGNITSKYLPVKEMMEEDIKELQRLKEIFQSNSYNCNVLIGDARSTTKRTVYKTEQNIKSATTMELTAARGWSTAKDLPPAKSCSSSK